MVCVLLEKISNDIGMGVHKGTVVSFIPSYLIRLGVFIRWTGMDHWTTGMDYWNTGMDYWNTGMDYWSTGMDYWNILYHTFEVSYTYLLTLQKDNAYTEVLQQQLYS